MEIYLDTSAISALVDNELPSRIKTTKRLVSNISAGRITAVISNVVLEELEKSPPDIQNTVMGAIKNLPMEIVRENDESFRLFTLYKNEKVVRNKATIDLRHLAVAVSHGLKTIVSWNFRDLVNVRTKRAINAVNLKHGLEQVEIVSPEEVIYE